MQELPTKNQHFYRNEKHQEAFNSVKQAVVEATALAAPNDEGRTDVTAVAIDGILHQEQEHNGKTIPRPIVYGSKSLVYAVFYFLEKFLLYLAGQDFTIRVDNQASSWLKIYSMDQAMIGH